MDIIRETKNKPYVVAISGVKNSGKMTFIEKLIPILKKAEYKVGTIKHDGHDFDCDVESVADIIKEQIKRLKSAR